MQEEDVINVRPKHNLLFPTKSVRRYTMIRSKPKIDVDTRAGVPFGPEDANARMTLRDLLSSCTASQHPVTEFKRYMMKQHGSMSAMNLRKKIDNLLIQLKPAELLLDDDAKQAIISAPSTETKQIEHRGLFKRIFQKDTQPELLIPQNDAFKIIQNLIAELESFRSVIVIQGTTTAFDSIIGYYNNFCEQLCAANSRERASMLRGSELLCTPEGNYYYLSSDVAQGILPLSKEGIPLRRNEAGSHTVSNYGGIHFKARPEAPSVELIIDIINRLITNAGSTPSMICKIYRRDYHSVLLASKSVEGEMLFDLLDKKSPQLDHIDPESFSAAIVSSILTRPRDNKGDNYIGLLHEITLLLSVTNIDQDVGLSSAFFLASSSQGDEKKHMVGIQNILYLFPEMHQPMGDKLKKHLETQSPALLLLDCLKLMMLKNKEYRKSNKNGVLTDEEMTSSNLPMRLRPGTLGRMYNDLQSLIMLCQKDTPITNADLLMATDPVLWKVYQLCLKKNSNIMVAYYKVLIHTPVEELVEMASPEDAMEILEHVSAYTEAPMEFTERTQSLSEALQELMSVVDFSELSVPHQKEVIERLMTFQGFTEIQLSNCEAIDDDLLHRFALCAPSLEQLTLIDCPNVTKDGLAGLVERLPGLSFDMSQNDHVGSDWPDIANRFENGFQLIFSNGFAIEFPLERADINEKGLLVDAAKAGSMEGFAFLLRHGASTEQHDRKGYTALQRAAKKGHIDILSELLKKDVEINEAHPITKCTALHFAVMGGHEDCVELLLKHGADVRQKNHRSQTSICLTARWGTAGLLYKLIEHIEDYESICYEQDDQDKILLHHAAANPDSGVLGYCLANLVSDCNAPDHIGHTPLHVASMDGLLENVALLVEYGADVNAQSSSGINACDLARRLGHVDVVEYLNTQLMYSTGVFEMSSIAKTVDEKQWFQSVGEDEYFSLAQKLLEKDSNLAQIQSGAPRFDTALHIVSKGPDFYHHEEFKNKSLNEGAIEQQYIEFIDLLVRKGASVNALNKFGETPLLIAANSSGSVPIVQCLLRNGADIFAMDENGADVLHLASGCARNQFNMVRFLLENGAGTLINKPDPTGMNLFMNIIKKPSYDGYQDQFKVFRYLLDFQMSKDKEIRARVSDAPTLIDRQKNNHMETPLHLAADRFGFKAEMIVDLVRAMRDVDAQDIYGNTALHKAIKYLVHIEGGRNKVESCQQSMPGVFLKHYRQVENAIVALLKSGARVNIENYEGETPITLANTVPHMVRLLKTYETKTAVVTLDKHQERIKNWLSEDDKFKEVYNKIKNNPPLNFDARYYDGFYDKYSRVYHNIKLGTLLSLVNERDLANDMEFAQKEMHKMMNVAKMGIDSFLPLHAEFFQQVFKRAQDCPCIAGRFNIYRVSYLILNQSDVEASRATHREAQIDEQLYQEQQLDDELEENTGEQLYYGNENYRYPGVFAQHRVQDENQPGEEDSNFEESQTTSSEPRFG